MNNFYSHCNSESFDNTRSPPVANIARPRAKIGIIVKMDETLNKFKEPHQGIVYHRLYIHVRIYECTELLNLYKLFKNIYLISISAIFKKLLEIHSGHYSITKRSLSTHHSTIFCRLGSDRNTIGSTQWRTEGHRGWIPYQRQMVL